jgi:predicted HTH transcriptional regulator
MGQFSEFLSEYFQLKIPESDVKIYLRNLHLIGSQDKPTLTGILFFGRKPQEFLHHAKVIGAYIKGKDIAIPPLDKKEITGRIPEVLEDTQRFLKLYNGPRNSDRWL